MSKVPFGGGTQDEFKLFGGKQVGHVFLSKKKEEMLKASTLVLFMGFGSGIYIFARHDWKLAFAAAFVSFAMASYAVLLAKEHTAKAMQILIEHLDRKNQSK